MVELQGHWGERFGGVFVFWGFAALILARLQGHWGHWGGRFGGVFLDGFWQGQSYITIAGPKVDEVGPKMAPTQP